MGRVMKEHGVRRNELLDAAWELFCQHGYDKTPVSAIIDKIGVSKGTFYHYFKSKEDLLDAAIERITVAITDEIRSATGEPGLSAVEKLNRFMEASRKWKAEHADQIRELTQVVYRDENLRLRHKMDMRTLALLTPILTGIISQGVEEGVFRVEEDPAMVAELILSVVNVFAHLNSRALLQIEAHPENLGILIRRLGFFFDTLERILGAEKGSIRMVDREFIESFTRELVKREAES